MWLVPEFPGMDELRAFNQRMMQELSVDATANQMSGLLAAQPGGAQALADLKKEASKMQGFPVLQVTRVGISADGQPLAAPSVAPLPADKGNDSSAGKCDSRSGYRYRHADCQRRNGKARDIRARTRKLSLGAFMRHKPQAQKRTVNALLRRSATAGVLLESQTSIDHFSTSPADLSSFDVPAGYKQVTSPMVKKYDSRRASLFERCTGSALSNLN